MDGWDVLFEGTLESLAGAFSAMVEGAEGVARAITDLADAVERRDNPFVRFPFESPLDYVKRKGPRTGHTIYPDEEWRYKDVRDWWGTSEKDTKADRRFHQYDRYDENKSYMPGTIKFGRK